MSSLIRIAKSGGGWGYLELDAFNTTVENVNTATFFGDPDLPPPSSVIFSAMLNIDNLKLPALNLTKNDEIFFGLLGWKFPLDEEETHVDFVVFLLDLIDYDLDNRVIRRYMEL